MSSDYGFDLECSDDLLPTLGTTSGKRLVGLAVWRRWQTPIGGLMGSPNYGFDVVGRLNDDMSSSEIEELISGMSEEAKKEEAVLSCSIAYTFVSDVLKFTATIDLLTGETLSLVLGVADVTLELLEIS